MPMSLDSENPEKVIKVWEMLSKHNSPRCVIDDDCAPSSFGGLPRRVMKTGLSLEDGSQEDNRHFDLDLHDHRPGRSDVPECVVNSINRRVVASCPSLVSRAD